MSSGRDVSLLELSELAALLAAGALAGDEEAAARLRLESAGEEARAELAELEDAAGWLGLTAEPVEPPEGLRGRLLDRIDQEIAQEAGPRRPGLLLDEGGILIMRSADLEWTPVAEGVAVKVLHGDPKTGVVTQLMRLDAGCRVPKHRHGGEEELLLLHGDARVNGVDMVPGDYCLADPESVHQSISSERGAIALMRSAGRDEFLI